MLFQMEPGTSRFLSTALLAAVLACPAAARDYRLTVKATAVDRAAQVIAFPLPADAPQPAILRAATGAAVPLQVDADGTARFIVPTQKAGDSLTLTLTLTATLTSGEAGVTVTPEPGGLQVTVAGRPALAYRMDREYLPPPEIAPALKRAGYLHPLFSPAGRVVTGDFPANHAHHHAVWTAWPKTRFQGRAPNSWEMAEQTGTVEFVALDRTWDGPVHGGFVARQRMLDLSASVPVPMLDETWELTAYCVPGVPVQVFDLAITQACATSDALELPTYHYGGLGYRGPDAWDGKPNLRVLTSNGETDREKANLTRVNWCYVGGADAGTAVLGHPGNFRAPQPIRVHPDMPFLCFAPSQLGDWNIAPGRPYVARYRCIITDGVPDRALLNACWNAYAHPADVTLESL